jgi:Ca2+-binding RTX toxin-like protein
VLLSFENAIGGSGNDVITGSGSANVIDGGGGDDTINAAGGDDRIIGGIGNDRFVMSGLGDVIVDFGNGDDLIDLTAIDANPAVRKDQAFGFGGETSTIVAHSVTWHDDGVNTFVHADVDGNTGSDVRSDRNSQPDILRLPSVT